MNLEQQYEKAKKERMEAELQFDCADHIYIDVATLKLTAAELKERLLLKEIQTVTVKKTATLQREQSSLLSRIYSYFISRKEKCQI